MKQLRFLFIVIIAELLGLIGDFSIKKATLGVNKIVYLFAAGLVYASSAIAWYFVMKEYKLVTANVFHALGNLVIGLLLGIYIFKEKLNINEIIGLSLSFLALYFLMKK